jgi:hypothetical protein
MSDRRVVLDAAAFLDAMRPDQLPAGAKAADVKTVLQRYLTACYVDSAKAPHLMDGDDVAAVLRESLPRHFGTRDPLATITGEVLSDYLGFLDEHRVVIARYEQRRALDENIDAFLDAVAKGTAHAEGVAVVGKPAPVVHRAERVGRNDPCPCGSGRKFKKCCATIGSD